MKNELSPSLSKNTENEKNVLTFFTDKQIETARFQKIVKSNDFLRTLVVMTKLTPKEFKLLAFIISRIKPLTQETVDPSSNGFDTIAIKSQDMCKIFGLTYNGKNVADLCRSLKRLADKSEQITFVKDGREETMLFRWLDTYETSRGRGIITLRLSSSTKPFLLHLRESFTSYEFSNLLVLKGKSIFLFDLLATEAYKEHYTISVEDLRTALQIEKDKYVEYKDFNKRILKPAINKINTLTQLEVDITEHREERKIKYLTFHMRKKDSTMERLQLPIIQKSILDGMDSLSELQKAMIKDIDIQ